MWPWTTISISVFSPSQAEAAVEREARLPHGAVRCVVLLDARLEEELRRRRALDAVAVRLEVCSRSLKDFPLLGCVASTSTPLL
mmetsp:Transcript_47238/g.153093  ORF Transcript_47238/g.153093 Transcript_47238/m.153093 type:complete len:84 (+) Transcript_47238:1030-1281(+)